MKNDDDFDREDRREGFRTVFTVAGLIALVFAVIWISKYID